MTDIAFRTFRPGFLARLIGRFLAWMDEPVVLEPITYSHFNGRDRADLPVHHPIGDDRGALQ